MTEELFRQCVNVEVIGTPFRWFEYARRIGAGLHNTIDQPQENKNLQRIVSVAGGFANFSVFLDEDGNVFTCGFNNFGQLGHGDKNDRNIPQKVENIPPISSLSSSNSARYYFHIVDCEGRVWGCGNNENGQLGLGDQNVREI